VKPSQHTVVGCMGPSFPAHHLRDLGHCIQGLSTLDAQCSGCKSKFPLCSRAPANAGPLSTRCRCARAGRRFPECSQNRRSQ
jgi:hypothetical protein